MFCSDVDEADFLLLTPFVFVGARYACSLLRLLFLDSPNAIGFSGDRTHSACDVEFIFELCDVPIMPLLLTVLRLLILFRLR